MARRPVVFALLVFLGACSSSGAQEAATTTTTVAVEATTTTAAPIETTTSTAPPLRLPAAATTGEVRALVTTTGVVVPVYGGSTAGWQVGTPCGKRAVVAGGTPIHGATVVLDPGHGGIETGAVGANGLVERDLNLAVAKLVQADLEREGATVVMTRTADYRVPLDARAALAQRLKPPVFLSIHHNGGADGPSDKPGTEMYYQHASPASKRLAGLLYEEVFKAFAGRSGIAWNANVDAGAKFRLSDRGGDYYGVLRGTSGVTAVISEGLFLSASRSEADLLARPDVQAAEAEAITRAVRRFMLGADPGSGFVQPIRRDTPAGGGGGAAGCVDPPLSR
jgi:N-acetylmuramoyl-L-alanine amidase